MRSFGNVKRQKTQYEQMELAFAAINHGEAEGSASKGTETSPAKRHAESPVPAEDVMVMILESGNLKEALRRVKANKGSPGVDGITTDELTDYLRTYWKDIRAQLLEGKYRPSPVKRVERPKPNGGIRKLGIPTTVDRFVQQAVMQVLQSKLDKGFSESSYGFRPGRSAHQAVLKARQYARDGYGYVVDMDLEKFFDRVNHDILMNRVSRHVPDKRVLKVIRSFLNSGVMVNGIEEATAIGTPQGGPLSPLLSNLLLDDLDKELEKRGHKFVRYADDCNIYVRSERAGRRVLGSIRLYLEKKLKLKINEEKSAVAEAGERKFLGFRILRKDARILASKEAEKRFKQRVRELTRRVGSPSIEQVVRRLATFLRGWGAYFAPICEVRCQLSDLDSWIRRRLRCLMWWQWRTPVNRAKELFKRGISRDIAIGVAKSSTKHWQISLWGTVNKAIKNKEFAMMGLPSLSELGY